MQEVIAAMSTSPCPMSTGTLTGCISCAGTRSGVGRLVIISVSVSGFVSVVVTPFRFTSGKFSESCAPPPATCATGSGSATSWNRLPISDLGLP